MGMTNVYFKMAGFDPEDLEHVLRLASKAQVDMVTFDGAGGGSGYSPCKMMNEWCLPTVVMESILYGILDKLAAEGMELPDVAITGGFATEDQVYKALALGAPYISAVGLCPVQHGGGHERQKDRGLIGAGKVPRNSPVSARRRKSCSAIFPSCGGSTAARRTGSPPGPSGYIPT